MIGILLAELDRLLPAGRRRRRILLEAEDHLRCAVDAGVAAGLDRAEAEAAAVRDFGPAALLARRVRDELGSRAAVAASARGLALLGVLAAVYALRFTELANDAGTPPWWPDEPLLSLLSLLAIEVAVVAGAVTLVRLLRHGAAASTGAVRASLVRGLLVAATAGAVAAACDGVAALRHLDAVRSSHLALAVVGLGLMVLLLAAATASAGLRGLRAPRPDERAPHPVDDLLALLPLGLDRLEHRAPRIAAAGRRLVGRTAETAARHPRLTSLVDLRSHPWRVCAALAAVAFVLQAAGLVARDGLEVALVGGAVQGAAVMAAFALLGPVLGLRPGLVTSARGSASSPPSALGR
jgi:hypothetical protein